MDDSHKPKKRLIPMEQYILLLSKKFGLAVGSIGLAFFTAFCIVAGAVCILLMIPCLFGGPVAVGVILPFVAILLFLISWRLLQTAEHGMAQAQKEEDVLPLTRANLIHLPVSESLVRASDKPEEEHREVLLRAAGQSQETSVEELLRPIGTQEIR